MAGAGRDELCGIGGMFVVKEEKKPEFVLDDRGYNIKDWYEGGGEDGEDGLIRITRPDGSIKEFPCPSYKIWNYCAHFSDIVDGEIAKSDSGYRMASSTGLEPGTIVIFPKENES